MKKRKYSNDNSLSTLTIVGRILVFVPLGSSIITLLVSLLGNSTTSDYENIFAGTGMIFLCGLVILVYVAIKRFHQGYYGELENNDNRE